MGVEVVEDNKVETFSEFDKRTDERTLAQKALDIPMSAISGVATGGGALLALPEELPNLALQGGTWAGKKMGLINEDFEMPRVWNPALLPSMEQMENFRKEGKIGNYTIPNWKETAGKVLDYQPITTPGEFVQTGAEWAAPASLFGKTPAIISAGSGLFSESLEQSGITEKGKGWIPAVGVDVILNLVHGMRNPAHIRRLQEVMDGLVKNNKLDDAKDLMKFAQENNISISAPEAIIATTDEAGSTLQSLIADTMSNPKGGTIFNTFTKDRFPQISNANREWLNKNLGDMDLNTINIDNITNGFVNAVRKRADDYNKHITSRAKNYNSKIIKGGWDAFDNTIIVTSDGKAIKGIINANLKEYQLGVKKFIKDPENSAYAKIFQDEIGRLMPEGSVITHTNLHNIYKRLGNRIDALKKAPDADSGVIKLLSEEKTKIGQILNQNNYWKNANEFTRKANRIIVDKAMEGLQVGGRVNPNTKATLTLLNKVLLGSDISPVNIKKLYTELNKIDTKLFPEMSNLVLSKQFEQVMTAAGNKNVGFKFYEAVMGKGRDKLVKEIIYGSAKAQGKNPEKAWQGFQKLMNVYKASGTLPGLGSQTASRGEYFNDLRKLNIIIDDVSLSQPLEVILKPIRQIVADNRSGQLAKIFTSADGIDQMINIGKNTKLSKINNTIKTMVSQISREANESGISISGERIEKDDFDKKEPLRFIDGTTLQYID